MKLFKSYAYAWWQIGIIKLGLLAIGAAAGSYWNDFFSANIVFLIVIGAVASAYIWYVSFRQ